jgi:hypothetical protein
MKTNLGWPRRWKSQDGKRLCISDPPSGIGISIDHLSNHTEYCGYCMELLMLRSAGNQREFIHAGLFELGLN